MELILGITIVALCLVGGVFFGISANKKIDKNMNKIIDYDKLDAKGQLEKTIPYLAPKEMVIYDILVSILPKEFVLFPRIGIEKLLKPKNSLVLFNAVKDKFVDMVVFKRNNMEPIMVVDIYDTSIAERSFQEFDKALTKTISAVNIPIWKIEIKDKYDKNQLLSSFLDKLNPIALAEIRKQK